MKRKRPDRRCREVEDLIDAIKSVNEASKFRPDPYERERLLAEKSALQSALLREHGELFEILQEGPNLVGISGRDGGWDACHARIDKLDPDVGAWVRAQLRRP